MKTRSRIRRK